MPSHTSAKLFAPFARPYSIGFTPIAFKYSANALAVVDFLHGGRGIIYGTVKESGTPALPVVRRVRLYRKLDGLLIREAWSKPDGSYQFRGVALQDYYVVAFDHTGNFNAVIRDSIYPDQFTP